MISGNLCVAVHFRFEESFIRENLYFSFSEQSFQLREVVGLEFWQVDETNISLINNDQAIQKSHSFYSIPKQLMNCKGKQSSWDHASQPPEKNASYPLPSLDSMFSTPTSIALYFFWNWGTACQFLVSLLFFRLLYNIPRQRVLGTIKWRVH